jgi:hypothetical protein
MSLRSTLSVAAVALGIGSLALPALAQNHGGMQMPDQGRGMGMMMGQGMMGHGMMDGGMMSPDTMSRMPDMSRMMSSCSEMMQSMSNGADGRPNSQWQHHPNDNGVPD